MRTLRVFFALMFVLFFSLSLAKAENRSGKIVDFQGSVEVKLGKANWTAATKAAQLNQGDMIRTGANSTAVLELENAGIVDIKPNSELELSELTTDKKDNSRRTVLDLSIGEILIKAKKLTADKSRFEVKTPTSVVGVRGTAFSVKVDTVTDN